MEELSKIAMAYYQASTDHLQKLARDFFSAMDHDGDGKIDLIEFVEFMRAEGCDQMTDPFIFTQLDLDGNGSLDFVEVMTLYYIIKSGRPFCGHCKMFIMSTYLTCVGCLEDPNDRSFYLCLDCYIMQKCDHTHNNLSRFLDNYSLLEAMIKLKSGELRSPESRSRPFGTDSVAVPNKPHLDDTQKWNPSEATFQAPQQPVPPILNHHSWNQCVTPNAPLTYMVHNHTYIQNNYVQPPARVIPQRQRWQTTLAALNAAVQIGVIGSGLCSIL